MPLQIYLQTHAAEALAGAGFLLGLLFGAVAARANFCVMGAVSDFRSFGGAGRLAAVAVAAVTALLLTQAAAAAGVIDLSRSMYLSSRFNWAGAIGGGLLFGAGMVYAGGCASRNLIRAGGGDVRALIVVLSVAITAFATISGFAAPLRVAIENATAIDLEITALPGASAVAALTSAGLAPRIAQVLAIVLLALPLIVFAFWRGQLLHDRLNLLAGIGVGLIIAAGWLVTGMAYDEMALRPLAPQSLSFVRPVGDAIDWLQRSTALGLPGFGAASIFGTLAGSTLVALFSGRLRLHGFSDASDLKRHLGGAVAMGVGGVMALGCSIGQGITGLSTLSLQSILAAVSIFTGAWLALRRLERAV